MENWLMELAVGRQPIPEVKIQRGIFQERSLSPLLFMIAMISLNYVLRKCIWSYKFKK